MAAQLGEIRAARMKIDKVLRTLSGEPPKPKPPTTTAKRTTKGVSPEKLEHIETVIRDIGPRVRPVQVLTELHARGLGMKDPTLYTGLQILREQHRVTKGAVEGKAIYSIFGQEEHRAS
jgi:Fe2+ or Zn2+ uptake regulation protein